MPAVAFIDTRWINALKRRVVIRQASGKDDLGGGNSQKWKLIEIAGPAREISYWLDEAFQQIEAMDMGKGPGVCDDQFRLTVFVFLDENQVRVGN